MNTIQAIYYTYVVPVLAVAAGALGSAVLLIETGSSFEWARTSIGCQSGGADVSAATLSTLQLIDTSSNSNIFSQPAWLNAVAGDGRLPFILPETRVFAGGSSVTVQIVNGLAAQASFYLQLHGRKLYGM